MKEWGNYSEPKIGFPISYLRTKYWDFGLSGHIVKWFTNVLLPDTILQFENYNQIKSQHLPS